MARLKHNTTQGFLPLTTRSSPMTSSRTPLNTRWQWWRLQLRPIGNAARHGVAEVDSAMATPSTAARPREWPLI
eukprot:11188133-Lingulodinium_polyedra.AAC.1